MNNREKQLRRRTKRLTAALEECYRAGHIDFTEWCALRNELRVAHQRARAELGLTPRLARPSNQDFAKDP